MVTGIGGVFIKAKDPKALAQWYETNLGVAFNGNSYVAFEWKNVHSTEHHGSTNFSFFKESSEYFNPSESRCMINFRVMEIESLVAKLKAAGGWVDENIQSFDYGKFAWCMDPEGNKIELWEPIDG